MMNPFELAKALNNKIIEHCNKVLERRKKIEKIKQQFKFIEGFAIKQLNSNKNCICDLSYEVPEIEIKACDEPKFLNSLPNLKITFTFDELSDSDCDEFERSINQLT